MVFPNSRQPFVYRHPNAWLTGSPGRVLVPICLALAALVLNPLRIIPEGSTCARPRAAGAP
jgi:hypothetical protein